MKEEKNIPISKGLHIFGKDIYVKIFSWFYCKTAIFTLEIHLGSFLFQKRPNTLVLKKILRENTFPNKGKGSPQLSSKACPNT